MKIWYEDDLVEAVVILCASGKRAGIPSLQVHRFHLERERCYAVLDADARAAEFGRLHLEWFGEWGLSEPLVAAASQFPALAAGLDRLAFRKARRRSEEGAELYRTPEGPPQGMVALRPELFADPAALTRLLHHELGHVADMVDERFGYSPDAGGTGQTPAQQRLVLERYRLLWNVSVDGRLTRRKLATVGDEPARRAEFERAFVFLPEAKRTELFAELWAGDRCCHSELLRIAADPRDLREHPAPVPGADCPLCEFTAFEWIQPSALRPTALARLREDFPGWRDDAPICARCGEIYESITGLDYPPTVCL